MKKSLFAMFAIMIVMFTFVSCDSNIAVTDNELKEIAVRTLLLVKQVDLNGQYNADGETFTDIDTEYGKLSGKHYDTDTSSRYEDITLGSHNIDITVSKGDADISIDGKHFKLTQAEILAIICSWD